MRADRIKHLWPILEPLLRNKAQELLIKYNSVKYIEVEEILPEAFLAIKRIRSCLPTKRLNARYLSFLIQRGRWGMLNYLNHRLFLVNREIQDDCIFFI